MNRSLTVLSCSLILVFCNIAPVLASEITDQLKSTIDQVIAIVKDEKWKGDKNARREEMRRVIDPQFNYEQMSMRSLAANWNARSSQEKKEFVELFKRLLENSYASKIESFSNEVIKYQDEIIRGEYALVKTEVVRKDGTIDVDYKLIHDNGKWKIYDFVIEGVSMVKNYRSQFNRIIKKESYDALKKKMSAKIEGIEDKDFEG